MTNLALPKYRFIPSAEVLAQSVEIDWLIADYFPSNSIGMIYGPSGSGKSHIALNIAVMAATGAKEWWGHKMKKGHVLYMAGEGNTGIIRRLKAIQEYYEIAVESEYLHVSDRGIGVDTDQGFNDVIDAIDSLGVEPCLIIIDTLSRHLATSNENSNDDMAQFINKLELIKSKYKCTIIMIHHTGKDGKQGARGASAIRANLDFMFRVDVAGQTGDGCKVAALSCEKQKDASDTLPNKHFAIVPEKIGEDSEGNDITGACVINTEFVEQVQKQHNDWQARALVVFDKNKAEWQKKFLEICDLGITEESKKRRFRDIVKKLQDNGKVQLQKDGSYKLPESS